MGVEQCNVSYLITYQPYTKEKYTAARFKVRSIASMLYSLLYYIYIFTSYLHFCNVSTVFLSNLEDQYRKGKCRDGGCVPRVGRSFMNLVSLFTVDAVSSEENLRCYLAHGVSRES